jgi:hypothetical protein
VTFFEVAKNRCCKQSGYDDQIVENSKKSKTLRVGCFSWRTAAVETEIPPPAAMKNADVRNDKGASSRKESRRNLRNAGSLTGSVPLRS